MVKLEKKKRDEIFDDEETVTHYRVVRLERYKETQDGDRERETD